MNNIILTGMMGSGKSTIGKELSKIKGFTLFDTDKEIEEQQGLKITEIFEKFGEQYFRDLEKNIIKQLHIKNNLVVSLGGGTFCNQENINILKNSGKTIYLKTSIEEILKRMSKEELEKRPLLKNIDNLIDLLKKREYYYNQAKNIITTDNKPINEILNEIIALK